MIVYNIEDTASFMNKLLVMSVFDKFEFIRGEIVTFVSFEIDGKLHRSFFSSDEEEQIGDRSNAVWKEVKPHIYHMIKGKTQPLSLQIVLSLSQENAGWLIKKHHLTQFEGQVKGLYLNIRFKEGKVSCITGVSLAAFIPDKSLDAVWDETAGLFLRQNSIVFSADD